MLLCIWWDQLGVVYYELLKPNETITGSVYRTQLMRLSRALKKKRAHYYSRHDKIILLHDNARPHALSDFHLIGSMVFFKMIAQFLMKTAETYLYT